MTAFVDRARELLAIRELEAVLIVLAAIVLAKLADWLLCGVLRRLTRRTRTEIDDQLIALLHRPIFVSVALIGLGMATQVLELGAPYPWLLLGLIKTLAVLIWAGALIRAGNVLFSGLGRAAGHLDWIDGRTVPLFDNLAKILIISGAAYSLLVIWKLDVKPWLASAGIAGIAIGFAAKDSLANLFGGLSIIADAPYKIGDFINLDSGERGMVTHIGLRSTRLLTRDDVEVTVPNSAIANAKIVNESSGRWEKMRITVRIGVAYGSDVDQVREVLLRSAASVEAVLTDPPPAIRFTEMADSALIFRVLCWIPEPVLRGRTIDALLTEIYNNLNRAGITIPFPQRDVHMHQVS